MNRSKRVVSNSIFCGRFGRHPSRRRRVSGQNLQRKTNRRHVPNMETQKPPPSSSFVASFWVFFFFFSPGRRRAGTCPSKDHDSGSSITSNPSAPNHRDQKKRTKTITSSTRPSQASLGASFNSSSTCRPSTDVDLVPGFFLPRFPVYFLVIRRGQLGFRYCFIAVCQLTKSPQCSPVSPVFRTYFYTWQWHE